MLPFRALASLKATAGVKKRLAVHTSKQGIEPCSYHLTNKEQYYNLLARLFLIAIQFFRLEQFRKNPVYSGNPGNLATLGLICQGPPQGPRHLGSMRRIHWLLLASFALPRFHSTSCSLLGPTSISESAIINATQFGGYLASPRSPCRDISFPGSPYRLATAL